MTINKIHYCSFVALAITFLWPISPRSQENSIIEMNDTSPSKVMMGLLGDQSALGDIFISSPVSLAPVSLIKGDQFGYSIAIDHETLVIGAPYDGDWGTNAGAVYIYNTDQTSGNQWVLHKKIVGADTTSEDLFGYAVAISGDFIIVGAPLNDGSITNSGAAYLFGRNQGGLDNWGQVQKLQGPNSNTNDQFGISVSIDDQTLVVGAPFAFDNNSIIGSAHVFSRRQGQTPEWQHIRQLAGNDQTYGDFFGFAVTVSGDNIAIGSPLDSTPISVAGSVYIFSRNQGGTNQWGQLRKITASDATAFDQFGTSISMSGQTLVVGAPFNTAISQSGSAYIFDADQGGINRWGQVKKVWSTNGNSGTQFGFSLAIKEDWLLVGAPFGGEAVNESGSAYLFHRNEGGMNTWGQVSEFYNPTGISGDQFGASVALNDTTLVMGIPKSDGACPSDENCDSGSVYVLSSENPALPTQLSINNLDNSVIISVTGGPEEIIMIQASTNLNSSDWITIGSVTNDLAGQSTISITNLTEFPLRFFRAMTP